MADVFLSYPEESAGELAEQIAVALSGAGISCWCARRDMPFGGDFAREIPSQIDACKVFLLILNDSAVYQSKHVENEMGLAFSRYNHGENILILPLEFGDFKRETWIKYYLVHTQSVRFPQEPDAQRIQGFVKRLAKRLNPQTPPPTPEPKTSVSSYLSGYCGMCGSHTVSCTLALANGTLTIYGSGAMDNFSQTHRPPWWNERETIFRIEIFGNVMAIGTYAFDGCKNLTDVNIPYSMAYIGNYAFNGCTKLTSVNVPKIVHIYPKAFPNTVRITYRK